MVTGARRATGGGPPVAHLGMGTPVRVFAKTEEQVIDYRVSKVVACREGASRGMLGVMPMCSRSAMRSFNAVAGKGTTRGRGCWPLESVRHTASEPRRTADV